MSTVEQLSVSIFFTRSVFVTKNIADIGYIYHSIVSQISNDRLLNLKYRYKPRYKVLTQL